MEIDPFWVILPSVVQGAGMGLVFATMSRLTFATLDPKYVTSASAVFSLFRSVGASVGIAIINTYFSSVKQQNWNSLGGAVSPENPVFQMYAEVQKEQMSNTGFLEQVAELVQQQATMLGFVHCFMALVFMYLFMVLLLPLLRK